MNRQIDAHPPWGGSPQCPASPPRGGTRLAFTPEVVEELRALLNAAEMAAGDWGTGGYTKWRSLGGRRVTPQDESWRERWDDPRYGLMGREQSIDELFAAYGLEG